MTKRLSKKKQILFYIILICLPFVILETLVRAYFAIRVGPDVFLYGTPFSKHQQEFDPKGTSQRKAQKESTVAFHENSTGGYSKYHPHQKRNDRDEFGKSIDVTINAHGFRGRDFDVVKPPGVVRVVTLGASSTFGFKNHDDMTYPSLLEGMLNKTIPELNAQRQDASAQPIKAFEVINLGIPHLKSDQIHALFINEALDLHPDYVTFYEGINDAAWLSPPDTSTEKTKQAVKALPLANQIFRELRYRLLSVALFGKLISEKTNPYASKEDLEMLRAGKKEHFLANLQSIHDACRQNNIRFIVASQQVTGREGRGEDRAAIHGLSFEQEYGMVAAKMQTNGRVFTVEAFLMVHKELMDAQKQWANSNNIPYADVIRATDANRDYLLSWVHLNADGNRVIASVLAHEILNEIRGQKFPTTQTR